MHETAEPLLTTWSYAIFGSDLETGSRPARDRLRLAIASAEQACGGPAGCLAVVAYAYGDDQETAARRMRWARAVAEEALSAPGDPCCCPVPRPAPSRPSAPRTPRPARRADTGRRRVPARRSLRPPPNHEHPPDQRANDRAAELRDLWVMASHDLKGPLATVTAHVEMLRADHAALGVAFTRDLAAIERGLHRMTRLTEGLLEDTKADHTLDAGRTSLRDMVAEVIADHVGGPDSPDVTVPGTLPDVLADAGLLRHVLDNLVGNAVKYTRAGVTPRIEVSARTQVDGTALVEVADRGIGIPAADRSRIFDAFHRCANSEGYPGTGLGLAICQRIVERHGGDIGVAENPGGGSRFWFTVPAAGPDPADRLVSDRSAGSAPEHPCTC
jgi:signal transduction histidine kinase